jgi:MFS family permease
VAKRSADTAFKSDPMSSCTGQKFCWGFGVAAANCCALDTGTNSRTAITYWYERWRAVAAGVLETAGTTFLLLIAVKHFNAGALAKGLVASGGSLGLMLGPAVVSGVARIGWSSSKAAAVLAGSGACLALVMAALPFLPVFVAGSILAMTATSAAIPLLTQMYHENYPEKTRGKLFSGTVMIRIAVAAAFSEFAGQAFSGRIHRFQILLLIFAGAFALAGFCLWRVPTGILLSAEGSHPFRALRYAYHDALFRRTLICWMLMGFANLMMIPMRVEMLANPKYGLALSVGEIAFLTGVVPNTARILLSPLWGWLFDRANFFVLRVILNLGFAIGILTFFTSDDLAGLISGAVVFGISNAGGDIAWSLWVTKFAPENRVADYMSVHTFFTGLRGVVAPITAFQLARAHSLMTLGWVSAGLIVLSSALLLPEIKFGRRAKAREPLVEEVSE